MITGLYKKWLLQLRGLLLMCTGPVLLLLNQHPSRRMVLLFSALMFYAGVAGAAYLSKVRSRQIQKGWLMAESIGDIILFMLLQYLFFQPENIAHDFTMMFAFFSLTYACLQALQIFQIYQKGVAFNNKIVVARALIGIGYALSATTFFFMPFSTAIGDWLINLISIGPLVTGGVYLCLSYKLLMVKNY